MLTLTFQNVCTLYFIQYLSLWLNRVISKKAILALFLLLSPLAYGASFDCKLAKTDIEKMICANQSLSQMDEVINTLYFKALEIDDDGLIRKEQREWLKNRNIFCQTQYYCESYFAQRIEKLVNKPYLGRDKQTIQLTEGMTLPKRENLDEISSNALRYELIKEKYRPWPRKTLITSDSHYFYRPKAVVVDEQLFIYYLVSNGESRTLYEYSPFSGESYSVANVRRDNPYYIKDNMVYFYTEMDSSKEYMTITKYSYQPGSRAKQKELDTFNKWLAIGVNSDNKMDYIENRTSSSAPSDKLVLSNNEKKLAIATQYFGLEFSEFSHGLQGKLYTKANQLANWQVRTKLNTVAIFDSETNKLNVISDDAIGGDWRIGNLAWAQDDSSIFFDNFGHRACIWEYNLKDKQLHKIVPEHRARDPYAFTYLGKDYIVYTNAKSQIYSSKVSIMLAVRPSK